MAFFFYVYSSSFGKGNSKLTRRRRSNLLDMSCTTLGPCCSSLVRILHTSKKKGKFIRLHISNSKHFCISYSDNQKTMQLEDDIIAIHKWILWCYKANSFTRHFSNHLFCEMGLFTLRNFCVACMVIELFKVKTWFSKSFYYSRVFWLSL